MECAQEKTMFGDGVLILGAQLDTRSRRIKCVRCSNVDVAGVCGGEDQA